QRPTAPGASGLPVMVGEWMSLSANELRPMLPAAPRPRTARFRDRRIPRADTPDARCARGHGAAPARVSPAITPGAGEPNAAFVARGAERSQARRAERRNRSAQAVKAPQSSRAAGKTPQSSRAAGRTPHWTLPTESPADFVPEGGPEH